MKEKERERHPLALPSLWLNIVLCPEGGKSPPSKLDPLHSKAAPSPPHSYLSAPPGPWAQSAKTLPCRCLSWWPLACWGRAVW